MPVNFDCGIFSLFAWLVPHVSIEVGEFRRSMSESDLWSGKHLGEGKRVVSKHALIAILSALLVIIGTATAVALTTQGLDPNMVIIIEGISYFMAAFVTLVLSWKSPKWIGVYYSRKRVMSQPTGRCLKTLAFNVRWAIWRQFCRAFFCLLPFYCGANAVSIPVSMVSGLAFGFLMDFVIYLGRRKREEEPSIWWAMGMAFVIVVVSCALFQKGTRYIDEVWGRNEWEGKNAELGALSAVVWFVLAVLVHIFLWCRTQKKVQEVGLGEGVVSGHLATSHTRKGDRLATSLVKEMFISYKTRKGLLDDSGITEKQAAPSMPSVMEGVEDKGDDNVEDDEEEVKNSDIKEQPQASTENCDNELPPESLRFAGLGIGKISVDADDPSNGGDTTNLNDSSNEEYDDPPSMCSLIRGKLCGCKRDEWKEQTCLEKTVIVVERILWVGIACGFTFFTIINIGAQQQVASVNRWFPVAEAMIYTNMDLGKVCAIAETAHGPNSNITTFPSKEDANAAGFRVLHCGACGACSTWHNLRLEWWTRNYLAAESARCAKKSLGGGRNAVYECLMKEPIHFDNACSECWTEDIICTKNHCAFIYLQSQLINKVGKFDVAPGEITSATCEEAHCEMDPKPGVQGFVNCSGATRRRMSIKSAIDRPPEQQCRIVEVNWEDLFGPCCDNVRDFYPAMATVRMEEGRRGRELQ